MKIERNGWLGEELNDKPCTYGIPKDPEGDPRDTKACGNPSVYKAVGGFEYCAEHEPVSNTYKLQYRRDGAIHALWLDDFPKDSRTVHDSVLTISNGEREVLISGCDDRVPPEHLSVGFSERNAEYWQDCGEKIKDARVFAERVLLEGAAAYEDEEVKREN